MSFNFCTRGNKRDKLFDYLDNQQGSIMLIVLLILSLLTVIGLSSSKTTWIEMGVSNNQTIHKLNFYQAEAAISEGMQNLEDTDLENNPPFWIQPLGSGILTTGPAGTEGADVYTDAIWDQDADADGVPDNSQVSQSFATAQMMGAYRGLAPGSSVSLGASRIHVYDVYGKSQQNNGLSIIKMSYRKAY